MAFIRSMILLLLCATALSLPIDRQLVLTNDAGCHSVNLYTADWFLRNTLPQYRQEIHGKALFYTRGASKYAQKLACSNSKEYVSLWHIWPEWLYDDADSPNNPLRCIHNDQAKQLKFYENMSQAYARLARDHATVMHLTRDYANPPRDGIWGRIELPALRRQTDILEMDKINEDRSWNMKWSVPEKGDKSIIDKAIEEVRKILLSAKTVFSPTPVNTSSESCALWASHEDNFLDSLW